MSLLSKVYSGLYVVAFDAGKIYGIDPCHLDEGI
jgi:hypothetical protein